MSHVFADDCIGTSACLCAASEPTGCSTPNVQRYCSGAAWRPEQSAGPRRVPPGHDWSGARTASWPDSTTMCGCADVHCRSLRGRGVGAVASGASASELCCEIGEGSESTGRQYGGRSGR